MDELLTIPGNAVSESDDELEVSVFYYISRLLHSCNRPSAIEAVIIIMYIFAVCNSFSFSGTTIIIIVFTNLLMYYDCIFI